MVIAVSLATALALAPPTKPLMKDFIGLNVHTVQFRPDLYAPVAKRLRDYHGFDWDVGDDSSYAPKYPMSRNGVNWESLYGTWTTKGYGVSVCLMFDGMLPPKWKDLRADAEAFGERFARYFGPSAKGYAEAIEIGNEPGKWDDASYAELLRATAKGIRRGDPKLTIVTCAMQDKASGDYHKSLSILKGTPISYDKISVHTYAQAEGWPTWRRSYPEDPAIPYLKDVRAVIDWRNRNAPGKGVWVTEFGWDSSTKKSPPWVGVTDLQQAQYIVRSYLVFSTMDLERAYLFWFNDDDHPSLHASSGLTRGYVPKPSFHAVAQLQRLLGNSRFVRTVRDEPSLRILQFESEKTVEWVAWSPTGSGQTKRAVLSSLPGKLVRAEAMATEATAPPLNLKAAAGKLSVEVGESPTYLVFAR